MHESQHSASRVGCVSSCLPRRVLPSSSSCQTQPDTLLTLTWAGYCIFYLAVVCETGRGKDLGRAGEEETRVAWPIASPPIHGISWLADGGGSTSTGALLPGWAGNRPAAGGFSDTCQAPADELLLCASASARPGNFQIFVLCFPVRNDVHSPQAGFPPLQRTAGKEAKGRSMGECGARTPTPGYGSRSTLPIGASRPGSGALMELQPLHPKGASTVHTGCSTGCLDCKQGSTVCRPSAPPQRSTSTKPQSISLDCGWSCL